MTIIDVALCRRYFFAPVLAVLVIFSGLVAMPTAQAHAIIVETNPKPNAVLSAAPFNFLLRFNSRIDHLRSRMSIIDAGGTETALQLQIPVDADKMEAPVSGFPPGKYRLRWQVLAVDGHITRGDIPFRISE